MLADRGVLWRDPHDTRPANQIISMIQWIRTSRLSIKNSLSVGTPVVQAVIHGDVQSLMFQALVPGWYVTRAFLTLSLAGQVLHGLVSRLACRHHGADPACLSGD